VTDDRFDEFSTKLAGPQSRGAMLRTLLALAAGGALLPASALAEHEQRKIGHCITKGHICYPKRHKNRCCSGLTCKPAACGKLPCPHQCA
jgi:hypothetical protein